MKTLKVGVIGLGMGRNHVTGFNSHPNAEVVAVADIDEERLKERADALGVPRRYTDAVEMMKKEKLDIVAVATPNKFHAPLTLEAFKRGAHVFCEKPMAMNAREGKRMVEAAKKARRRLMINFSYRFTPEAVALKRQVDAGVIGEVYFGRTVWHRRRGMPGFGGWFGKKELSGGGPLIDLGVHRLDMALWLMGFPEPEWTLGATYAHIATRIAKEQGKTFDCEDFAAGMIRFSNGAMLEIEASWAANVAEKELMETRLFGTEGGLVHRNVEEGYKFEAEIFTERDGCRFDMKLHPPVEGVENQMRHFVDCILKKRPHEADGTQALFVQRILDALYKSATAKKPVRV